MAYEALMRKLQTAIRTGNERILSRLIRSFGLPDDKNGSDYELIRMALEEGHENISRILISNSCRNLSMKKASLKSLIELALEREYIDFLVLLFMKAIPNKAKNAFNNSLFYLISNIHDMKMMDYIINRLTDLSGINASDTENFQLLQLFIGIIRNDYTSLKRFKKMNIDINKPIVAKSSTLNGYAALHVAVLCEHDNFIKELLSFGSKTSVQDAGGLSPIHYGLKIRDAKINRTLFSAFMLQYDPVDHHGISPLHIACLCKVESMSRAKQYLQNFSVVNRQIMCHNSGKGGYTPLHLAVDEGLASLVQLLLNHGADLSIINSDKMSPLHLALFSHKLEIVDLLLTAHIGNLNNPVDYRGVSHFHIACSRGNIAVAEMFLLNGVALDYQVFETSRNWPLYSALHFAVLSSCTPIIKHLLSKGANPNCQNSEGFTPLNLACFEGLEKSVEVLLEFEVDLNIQNKRDSTPLQTAITKGYDKIVKRLLEKGVDINGRDNRNKTPPLITAILNKRSKIINYLLDNGANAAAKQHDGKTALHTLALLDEDPHERSSEVFIYPAPMQSRLLSRISRIRYDLFDFESYDPDDIDVYDYFFQYMAKKLITEGCDINARDNEQCTPLHLACKYGRITLVEILLQYGADIGALDNRKYFALQYVVSTYEPIAMIFYDHIMKLEYIGYPLNSWNKIYCDAKRARFFLRDVPSLLKVLYDRELQRMRNETIDNYFSLYDFLIKDPDDLLVYTNNSTLMKYIFHHHFMTKKYPELGALIQAHFRTAKKRARLFMLAKTSMQLFTKVPLPDPCLLNIFRYLKDEDVKQLILAL